MLHRGDKMKEYLEVNAERGIVDNLEIADSEDEVA